MMDDQEDCFHLGIKVLIRNNEGKILLLERDHPLANKYWDIPGGRLLRKESIMDTLKREVEEETGLKIIQKVHPFEMFLTDIRIPTSQSNVGLIFSIFLCEIAFSFDPRLSAEHVGFEWCFPRLAAQKLTQFPADFRNKLENL